VKIALIGDVHANLPALETALSHAQQQGITAIWNIGDWVGYNAFPDEVVGRLRHEAALSIVGNYDLKVLNFKKKKKKWLKTKRPEKWLAFQWAYKHLSKDSRRYLRSLPQERQLELAGRRILLTHGSPASNQEALTAETPQTRLRELAKMADADVVICGHSHRPFARQVDGVWFINTGSVGRPDDGDPRLAYAVLGLESGQLRVRHYRLDYDIDRAVSAIRQYNLPEAFAQMLIQGRNLDEVDLPPA
jgi:putative phosphoesterase